MYRKAVFLDRDGTINKEVDVLRDVRALRLLPGVPEAIRSLNKLGFLVIVISNQPVVARGWLTEKGVEHIHHVLKERLALKGARLDAIYYCPHHPNADLKKYRVRCRCRKPGIGLLRKAQREFGITMKKSYFIGDHTRDILAGKRAGVKTILVQTGYRGEDGAHRVMPDRVAKDLRAAAAWIQRNEK